MYFIKSLFIGALAVVAVSAQSTPTSSLIAFTTSPPSSVVAGELVTLGWEGSDPSQPVTITLRSGNADNLQTVRLVTGKKIGTSLLWTVPSDLPDGNDYTLSITQGFTPTEETTNYTGRFRITGGTVSSTSSSTSSRATATSSLVSSVSSVRANANTTIAANNPTTTIGSGVVGTGTSGAATGAGMSRNTTMSRPTLRSTSSSGASSTAAATTGTDPTGTSGGSGEETAAPDSSAMDAASFASPLALILSAVVAIVYLA
ncbi:MAG: hypothetical protein Q9185_000213 [Variospora sp. 1 TL-2023]